ncbi:hypothetical protein CFC21_027932 [Triticum aestivum]|uniref:Agenet domain-containing protein n=2 Tax=Triticum aestivum TaxID=4565 RepID=A0A9R1JDU9_WHEAT|nr:hypothetical protein CFC21_027932 [Triticum aestivum]
MSSSCSSTAVVDEGNAKMAVRGWVGWEEEIVMEDNDGEECKVCYFLRSTPPQDGGKSERDLAVVGKYWGPGNIAYSADLQFLQSLQTALESGSAPARVVTVAMETTQLRQLEFSASISDSQSEYPPYGAFGFTCPDNHDGASKDTLSTLAAAGENKEGFTWICKLPHLDQHRKHYKSFCREGMRISVHDFVFIKSGWRESHVAYVEDMYEDRDLVGYGLQDLRVQFVEGVAAVLNPQHFDMFNKISGGHSSWQPYVCSRQIEDDIVGPFDITQLQGYANQEIVKAIVAASSSTAVQAKPPNNKGKAKITGMAAENHAGSSGTVFGEQTMQKQKPPACNATPFSSSFIIGDKTMEKQKQKSPPCSATPSSYVISDKTMENSVIIDKTMEKQKQEQKEMPPPCTATPQSHHHAESAATKWYWRREKDNKVRVRYQDLSNFEDKGQLKEWLKVARITEPDHLGIRLTERPMLRPQLPTCYRKIESPIAVGVIVDAWLNGGWWEGIVLQQDNVGDVLVYLQGEGRLVELKVDSLRKSFEWREEQWIPLDARKDVADKITLYLKKQKGIRQSAMKKDGGSSSKQKAQKMGEKSSQTVAAAALTAAELAAPSPGLLQPREESDDETANSTLPRKRFLDQGYSFKEKTLEERAKKSKGPTDEAATPITEEGDGMSHIDSSPDAKRCRVDPTNFDGPNGAKPKGKARKSSRAKKMGSLEGSIHGGTSGSASTRCAASVNTVPMEDICITSGAAPIVAMDKSEVIDLTMYG